MRLQEQLQKEQQALAEKTAVGDSAAGAATKAPPAAAPDDDNRLGKVTVRTRNRLEPLQDVPVSISVVTGTELERLEANSIGAITRRAANVSWNLGNQRTSSLSIRGTGKQGQTEAQDPSVGFIVDGVNYAYNALTSSYDFYDVDTVEVARGPQGTLLGKNASLGVVNVTTKRPSFKPDANFSITYGELNTVIGRAAGGGPIIDDLLAWRGTINVNRGWGDIKNLYNHDQTYTNTDRVSGRVQLLLTPTPDFSARLAIDSQPRTSETTNSRAFYRPTPGHYTGINTSGPYAGTDINPLTTDASTRLARPWFTQDSSYSYAGTYLYGAGQNAVNYDNQLGLVTGSNGATADLNWTLGRYTLTSITAYKDYHFDAVNDDGTPFDVYTNGGGFWNDYKQFSQEVRLASQAGGLVDYQTGLFFMRMHNAAEFRRSWGGDAGAWFATPSQYALLDRAVNADGSVSGGRALLRNSLDGVKADFNSPAGVQDILNKSTAIFAQANWHISEPFTVTTGARLTYEDRQTTGNSLIVSNGAGAELNPVSVSNLVTGSVVQLGGFNSNTTTGALIAGGNSVAQLNLADATANKYFGVPITSTPGAAYESLTTQQKNQVAAAKSIRQSQIGVLFNPTTARAYRKTQPNFLVSPSYKINDQQTGYFSYQHGEKAGISQLTNGVSNLVKPEKTEAFELGLKSSLLNRTLTLNVDAFLMNIKDYQQQVRVVDQYTTALNLQPNGSGQTAYTSATGNVPRVQVKGVEFDGVYAGIPDFTIRFSGAYNDARYKDFPNSAQPVENGYAGAPAYQDVSGQALPGASKWSGNVGIDYRHAVFERYQFHVDSNVAYASPFNADVSLSSYTWIPSTTTVDFSVGISTANNHFDLSLLAKNLLNDGTVLTKSFTTTSYTYSPAVPRWWAVVFSGKL